MLLNQVSNTRPWSSYVRAGASSFLRRRVRGNIKIIEDEDEMMLKGKQTYINTRRKQRNRKTGTVRIMQNWGAFVQHYILWVCVFSLRYPTWKAHAPHYHLWPVWLYYIFPHYLTNGTIFEKKVTEREMCVSIFSTDLSKTFLILRRNEEIWSKMSIGLHLKYPSFLSDFNET